MATQWGRKETIIWPPHVPLMSYCAIAGALFLTLFFTWQRYAFQLRPLQKAYVTDYFRAGVGNVFHVSPDLPTPVSGRGRLASPVLHCHRTSRTG